MIGTLYGDVIKSGDDALIKGQQGLALGHNQIRITQIDFRFGLIGQLSQALPGVPLVNPVVALAQLGQTDDAFRSALKGDFSRLNRTLQVTAQYRIKGNTLLL